MHLRPGSALNAAGELTALPRPPSWIWGMKKSREERGEKVSVKEKNGLKRKGAGKGKAWRGRGKVSAR